MGHPVSKCVQKLDIYKWVNFIVGTLYKKYLQNYIQTGTPCIEMRAEVGYLQMWVENVLQEIKPYIHTQLLNRHVLTKLTEKYIKLFL